MAYKDPEMARARSLARYYKIADWFSSLKKTLHCQQCGETSCLEFHHRDPKTKSFSIAHFINHSKKLILEEIKKCDILCANCHRKIHAMELPQEPIVEGPLSPYQKKKIKRYETRQWFYNLKKTCCCDVCGEKHPNCLDFHHKNEAIKDLSLSEIIPAGWTEERIKTEVAKCKVLCVNCHRKLHDSA